MVYKGFHTVSVVTLEMGTAHTGFEKRSKSTRRYFWCLSVVISFFKMFTEKNSRVTFAGKICIVF